MFVGLFVVLEPKAPHVYKRRNRDVESAVCLFGYCLCKTENLVEYLVCIICLIVVDARYNRLFVERRKRIVNLLQLVFYFFLQVFVILIGYIVYRSEHKSRVADILFVVFLADNQYGADDKKQQKDYLYCSFHHLSFGCVTTIL